MIFNVEIEIELCGNIMVYSCNINPRRNIIN